MGDEEGRSSPRPAGHEVHPAFFITRLEASMRLSPLLPALALLLFAAPAVPADKRLDEAVAKAEAQLAKGKEDEAVKILEKAAAQLPRDPEAQLALARMLSRLGKLDQAAAGFSKAGELASVAPASVRARVLAGRSSFELRAGQARQALTLAQQALEAEAGAEGWGVLARAQARLGDPAARPTAERAVQAASSSPAAHIARGEALLAARLAQEAEAAYRRALELEAGSASASAGLALALAARGKAAPALEAARAATLADTHSAEALVALGLAALAQDPLDKSNEAIAAVQQASFMEPQNPLVKLALGRVFESRGQLQPAAASYGEASVLDPSWAAPPVAALDLRLRQGDAAGSLTGLRGLPEDLRASGDAQLLLGKLLLRREDWPGAKEALDRAVAAFPGSAEAQAAHGSAAYNVGELTLAADAYGRAVALEPDNVAYLSNYGLFLGYDERLDEGLSVLLKLTGRPDGQEPGSFINLGWVYRHFKPPRVAEAVAAYEKALKKDPKSGQAALGVALSYRAGRQWPRAITAYERVSVVDPKLDGEALLGTAWCHYRSGDLYKAGFFTGLAAKRGADVRGIRNALTKSAKSKDAPKATPARQQTEDDLLELVDRLGSKNAGLQARAVKALLDLGRPAVPYLAFALRQPGNSIAVRELIVDGLGRLGPAAREALPHLDHLIKEGPPAPTLDDSPAEIARQTREASLISAMQVATVKIRGK
jgi:tetratricopeptide (TPR) repeat protein